MHITRNSVLGRLRTAMKVSLVFCQTTYYQTNQCHDADVHEYVRAVGATTYSTAWQNFAVTANHCATLLCNYWQQRG